MFEVRVVCSERKRPVRTHFTLSLLYMLLKKKKKSVYVLNLLWRGNTVLLAKEIIPPRVKTSVILSKSSRNNPWLLVSAHISIVGS